VKKAVKKEVETVFLGGGFERCDWLECEGMEFECREPPYILVEPFSFGSGTSVPRNV
jgi:hypothetical protein